MNYTHPFLRKVETAQEEEQQQHQHQSGVSLNELKYDRLSELVKKLCTGVKVLALKNFNLSSLGIRPSSSVCPESVYTFLRPVYIAALNSVGALL